MWFLDLMIAMVVGLIVAGVVGDVRRRRRLRTLGDTDFATRDRRPVQNPRSANEADLDLRSNGRLRNLGHGQDGGNFYGGSF
jgi:hypothetical protein